MTAFNPYLNFNGNAEEAFNFYKSVFGGEFATVQRFKDVPQNVKMPNDQDDKILHIALPLGNGTILMGSDIPDPAMKATFGDNYFISVSTDSENESDNLFSKLSSGGKILMPLDKTFWGAYFGMLKDKFGIQWMISYDYNSQ